MKTEAINDSLTEFSWIPKKLSDAKVAIWGIGLMGGSLALALSGKTSALYGIDPDAGVKEAAEKLGIFTQVSADAEELMPKADLIVMCCPLGTIPHSIRSLDSLHPGHAVVIDIGSTKTEILQVMQALPERFAPIGGHPMCGKEVRTLAEACSDLYLGASFALLPLQRTPQAAARLALQLVEAIGAVPIWLEPDLHDRWVASISHLPFVVSNCLAGVTPLEAAPLVGPGFKSTTRLAVESLDMIISTLQNNQENVLTSLRQYQERLEQIESHLAASDFKSLKALFEEGAEQRIAILDSFHQGGGK